jgi:glycerate kinase
MAAVSGLTLLDEKERNPMKTTSFGTGEMIRHAIERGCRKFFITIGGSATNDAGLGAMQALGVKVLDGDGKLIRDGIGGGDLIDIEAFDVTDLKNITDGIVFNVACDVNNTFYGKDGAAYVYGPQKGATIKDIVLLDNGLKHVSDKIREALGYDIANIKGSGAAGGMGGALYAFLSADLSSGVELTLDLLEFDKHIADADLIVTGEGRFDEQTLRGKVVAGVVDRAERYGKKVLVLTGRQEYFVDLGENVTVIEVSPRSLPLSIVMGEEFTFTNIIRCVNGYLERSE